MKEISTQNFFLQKHFLLPQKIKAQWKSMDFHFYRPAKTSRNTLLSRKSFFLLLRDEQGRIGIGEAAPIVGLSKEWLYPQQKVEFCQKMEKIAEKINKNNEKIQSIKDCIADIGKELEKFPALTMALETAWTDLCLGGKRIFFSSPFCENKKGIAINGLVWMGEKKSVKQQIQKLLERGFDCIKMKIDKNNLAEEIEILAELRKENKNVSIRLDANGCFENAHIALKNIEKLYKYNIHSIEQPLPPMFEQDKKKTILEWQQLLKNSPIDLAFDEELIYLKKENRENLLENIKTKFLVLKPSLLGGWSACEEWIKISEKYSRQWWITSALESNIGLNAIAQWTFAIQNRKKSINLKNHGLGTGELFSNNFISPIKIHKKELFHTKEKWDLSTLLFHFPK